MAASTEWCDSMVFPSPQSWNIFSRYSADNMNFNVLHFLKHSFRDEKVQNKFTLIIHQSHVHLKLFWLLKMFSESELKVIKKSLTFMTSFSLIIDTSFDIRTFEFKSFTETKLNSINQYTINLKSVLKYVLIHPITIFNTKELPWSDTRA